VSHNFKLLAAVILSPFSTFLPPFLARDRSGGIRYRLMLWHSGTFRGGRRRRGTRQRRSVAGHCPSPTFHTTLSLTLPPSPSFYTILCPSLLFLQVSNTNFAFHHTIYARQVEDEELELDEGAGIFELGPDGGAHTHRVIDSSVASAIAASPAAAAFFEACRP
jgi:hypothetical protein